jgi:hypothetical protein
VADKVETAVKVTLSTGKVVVMRQMKIRHQTLAAQAVGKKAGDNTMAMVMMMQQELIKLLVISIDGRALTGAEREDLDSFLDFPEFQQLQSVVGQMMGGNEVGEAKTEIVTTGTP